METIFSTSKKGQQLRRAWDNLAFPVGEAESFAAYVLIRKDHQLRVVVFKERIQRPLPRRLLFTLPVPPGSFPLRLKYWHRKEWNLKIVVKADGYTYHNPGGGECLENEMELEETSTFETQENPTPGTSVRRSSRTTKASSAQS
jgi:hypothetical protein